jgi:hypothetical protein
MFAVFAGGCAGLASVIGLIGGGQAGWGLLAVSVPFGIAAVVVMFVNVMLILSLRRGGSPRRNPFFVMLAIVDCVAAACFTAGIVWNLELIAIMWLPVGLALKGALILNLPVKQAGADPDDVMPS